MTPMGNTHSELPQHSSSWDWGFLKLIRTSFQKALKTLMNHSTEKIRRGNPFMFQNISGIEKFYEKEVGSTTIFSRKFFVSQYRKIWKGNPFMFQNISGIEKSYEKEVGSTTIFSGKFFVSEYRKISKGNHFMFQKISGIKNFHAYESGVQDFSSY